MANLLDVNTSGLESTIGLWVTSGTNTTLTRSSTQARTGSFSAKLVATAGSDYAKMVTSTYVTGVNAGDVMTFEWYAYPTSSNMYYEADVDWYTSGGVYISSTFYSNLPGPLPVNKWSRCFIDGTAPATATKAIVQVQMFAASAGDVCYVDDVYFGSQHSIIVAGDGPVQSLIGSYGGFGSTGVSVNNTLESGMVRKLDVASDYMPYAAWSDFTESTLRTNQLDGWATWRAAHPGSKLVFGVPVTTSANVGDFSGVVAGTYDTYFTALANALLHSGNGDAWVMLGWEANNPNIGPWQACDNPSGFISAYQHVVTLMKGVSSNLKFIWSSALYITSGHTLTSLSSYYPGDSYVDFVGYNVYDMGYDNDSRNDFQKHWAFQVNVQAGMQEFRSFAVSHSKPECLPEWGMLLSGGATNGGGDNPAFIANMAAWFASSTNLAYQSYFNVDWDSTRGSALSHFTNGAVAYKARIGGRNAVESAAGAPYYNGTFNWIPGEAQPGTNWPGSVDLGSTSVTGADTGAGADSAVVSAQSPATDSGSGTDTAAANPQSNAASDTGSGLDSATVRVTNSDVGLGTDTAQVTPATQGGSDTGNGSDTANVSVTAADTGSGADNAAVSNTVQVSDTGSGADLAVKVTNLTAETSTGTDSGVVSALLPASDTGSGTDTAVSHADLPSGDTGSALDASTVRSAASDTGSGLDAAILAVQSFANDPASGLDGATVLVYAATDAGVGTDNAIVGTVGLVPNQARVHVVESDPEVIRGSVNMLGLPVRTVYCDADPEVRKPGDDDNRTMTVPADENLEDE